ncbi:cytochrome-c peroxidase [Sphingobacterium tabacisoli]|uniref:Cytochrome-c peroxidase n=1 Tax=Sphingobacterium tabacisoli TaxID=2044855 RepID=A0ABW5KY92_9SPHI|nr:cytochrome c peroxidase [Sphingobacterium tabacisoli]
MHKSNSGKLVIVSVFFVAAILIIAYQFLVNNDSPINIDSPAHFGTPINQDDITVQGASLGRQLFNDVLLSRHQQISCASCHQQTASYADLGKRFSIGDRGLPTTRNAPVLINLIWKSHYFADGRADQLEETIYNAIRDTLELNSNIDLILERVRQHPIYSKKLKTIFQVKEIEKEHVIDVLTQYLRTLNSWDSRYDRMLRGDLVFTAEEKQGQMLFESECASCHIAPFFHSNTTMVSLLNQKLQSPSLRNIHASAPYMHDGRFDGLDSLLLQHPEEFPQTFRKRALNQQERKSIITFLKTLSDEQFLNPNSY